jgi:DNA-directed RNA polymerase subunit RPC12/RpoP
VKELLENAVLSIELGVEDYQTGDERRVLSAIRNLYAGVLLLCKQVLWNASPPGTDGSLIYKDLVPRKIGGSVLMVPKKPHRNTVDRQQIEERFKELGLTLDWSKLQDLAQIRNDVEHLFMMVKSAIAKEALASAMPVIEQLLVDHLQEEPAALFNNGIWKALLEDKDVFEQQQARCAATFQNVDWKYESLGDALSEVRCSICGSSLVRQIDPDNASFEAMELDCAECGEALDRDDIFEAAIQESMASAAYIAMTDGGELPVTTCPECHRDSWVNGEGCVLCPGADLTCSMCQEEFSPDDFNYDVGTCSYCSSRMDKIMRE